MLRDINEANVTARKTLWRKEVICVVYVEYTQCSNAKEMLCIIKLFIFINSALSGIIISRSKKQITELLQEHYFKPEEQRLLPSEALINLVSNT